MPGWWLATMKRGGKKTVTKWKLLAEEWLNTCIWLNRTGSNSFPCLTAAAAAASEHSVWTIRRIIPLTYCNPWVLRHSWLVSLDLGYGFIGWAIWLHAFSLTGVQSTLALLSPVKVESQCTNGEHLNIVGFRRSTQQTHSEFCSPIPTLCTQFPKF